MSRSLTAEPSGNDPDEFSLGGAPSYREHAVAFGVLLTALLLSHAWLLRLPYFWDEAGYFIPAARDLLLSGDLIPHSTLSNAHPPLLMIWLAACWKVFGYSTLVTRTAMLAIAACALLGLWRLACVTTHRTVAAATVLCTALYPVFFAQSSLAHLDMLVAALTLWGLSFYIEGHRRRALVLLAVVPLAKETAIITPLALFAWELVSHFAGRCVPQVRSWCTQRIRIRDTAALLLCILPLGLWLAYHRHRTGFVLGNPEYLRYNLQATVTPLRIVIALGMRLWHVLGYMNLFVLTVLAAVALRSPAVIESGTPRRRIALPVQAVFAVVIAVHLMGLAILGGAVLARYMLPVVPLVILLCVNTLYRRMPGWRVAAAVAVLGFLAGIFFNPPYRFAPEDNLTYADYVVLHQKAAFYLQQHNRGERVLTAWPASDELTKPYLGYVSDSISVVRIENFSEPQIQLAAAGSGQYRWAYLFSTKYEPGGAVTRWRSWNRMLERFFDYHRDVDPAVAAAQLGGKIVYRAQRRGEWIALVRTEGLENAGYAPAKEPETMRPVVCKLRDQTRALW